MSLLETLLIVDDSPMSLDSLARHLVRRGFEVEAETSGEGALAAIRRRRFALVLLDVMMPDMNGGEVLRRIREEHLETDLPVIMVTARNASEDVVQYLGMGANDYVTKPIDLPVLLARIQTHLRLLRLSQLKDRFISMASHDLKSPLTTVLTGSQMVRILVPTGAPMTDEAYELLGGIEARARGMSSIISDFLDFEVLKEGKMALRLAEVDVEEVARLVVQAHAAHAASKGIRLAHSGAASVRADRERLAQILDNLVSNAVKFSQPGTAVTLSIEPAAGHVEIRVRDAGPGIPADEMDALFTRWSRLTNRPTGSECSSGLGLAICKELVALHGGEIGAISHDGGGSTFWVRLPKG